jgi:hypothetical protein
MHFFATKAGLQTSLLRDNIMNKETGHIDMSRVLNIDESPQYVDFHAKVGNNVEKKYCGAGDQAVSGEAENRECNTVDLCWGADGFGYGTQIIVARKQVTTSMTLHPDTSPLKDSTPFAQLGDPTCDELTMQSSHVLISTNDCGVQTGITMIRRLEMLDMELTQRGVLRPVCLMVDNADRIFADDVMAYCAVKQINIFTEKSKTSHLFQALDQQNEKMHHEYRKASKLLKATRAAPGIEPSTIRLGLTEFFDIMYQIMFTWCTSTDRRLAWKNVGITAEGLRPDFIDRTHFKTAGKEVVDAVVGTAGGTLMSPLGRAVVSEESREQSGGSAQQTAASEESATDPASVAKPASRRYKLLSASGPDLSDLEPVAIPSPPGVRKYSAAYYKYKLEAAAGMLQRSLAVPEMGPKALGLLDIAPFKAADKKRAALSDVHGSFYLNDVEGVKKKKRAYDDATAKKAQDNRDELEERRSTAASAALLERALWDMCSAGVCHCEGLEEGEGCSQLHLKLCSVCNVLKKTFCKVKACLEKERSVRCIVHAPAAPAVLTLPAPAVLGSLE